MSVPTAGRTFISEPHADLNTASLDLPKGAGAARMATAHRSRASE